MTCTIDGFQDVSLLITHYNRPASLERLLKKFKALGCDFGEVVVSDDASSEVHLDTLRQLQSQYKFNLVTSEKNGGLGSNMNKGQSAVSKPLTLYVQEDFSPSELFPKEYGKAIKIMGNEPELDCIRFFAHGKYPYLARYDDSFSRMVFKIWHKKTSKIYVYSDLPHLRRSNFIEKFGPYRVGLPGDRIEYWMCISFIQKKGKALFFNNCRDLFLHENSDEEPSTMKRSSWRRSRSPLIAIPRQIYRQMRYNFDILFTR